LNWSRGFPIFVISLARPDISDRFPSWAAGRRGVSTIYLESLRREDMERHVSQCWHCVDHLCRMLEVVEQLRGLRQLSDAAAEPFRKLLGIAVRTPSGWKRL